MSTDCGSNFEVCQVLVVDGAGASFDPCQICESCKKAAMSCSYESCKILKWAAAGWATITAPGGCAENLKIFKIYDIIKG